MSAGSQISDRKMRRLILFFLAISFPACERGEPQPPSIEDPRAYRAATAEDRTGRALFAAGLSLPLPPGASLSYPQGIDSRLMHIEGEDYTLELDDYGAFDGPATTSVAGAPAAVEVQRTRDCLFRLWRIKLPATSPTHLTCPSGGTGSAEGTGCQEAPARATIATFCTSEAACRQVDAILAGVQFSPSPWPEMPLPDPDARPKEPACRPG